MIDTKTFTLPTLTDIETAAELIYKFVLPTPQYSWPMMNRRTGCELWIKHENHLPVGAFKLRGGIVYMDWLRRTHPEVRGVISATRGNHGQSQAFAAKKSGLHAVVVVPHGNSREKNAAMQALGAELIEYGDDFHAADHHADVVGRERGLFRMPSFDPLLVRGVATYAVELFRGAPPLDAVFVPIGWGSGAVAVASAKKALGLHTKIIGVVSAKAPNYALSLPAGKVVEQSAETRIADGIAIGRAHEVSLEILRRELERIVRVTDDDVEDAMRAIFEDTHNVAEGAGAAPLAAVLKEKDLWKGKRVATILTGGNVDREVFARVLSRV